MSLKMQMRTVLSIGMAVLATLALGHSGLADQPHPWQLGLQEPASTIMSDIVWFHNYVMYIITAVTIFVLILLVMVVVKFNAGSNPVPTRTTHNTAIEVAWTLVPVLI